MQRKNFNSKKMHTECAETHIGVKDGLMSIIMHEMLNTARKEAPTYQSSKQRVEYC